MRNPERGSSLIIATIVVLIIAVIGVGMLRFTAREVAGATAGTRADALAACAAAAQKLLESRFHALGVRATDVDVLDVRMDGPAGRLRAVGGHIDGDPTRVLVDVKQVERLPGNALVQQNAGDELTNTIVAFDKLGGEPLKVTVHCQEGDLSSPTSGRQLEIEYAVKFGL
jgi:Tfp pilus assembly protein PilX